MKVLIVEDELLIADYLREIILQAGYDVVGVEDNLSDSKMVIHDEDLDLVFLDIRLANNDNGIELGKILSEKNIRFIYITANNDMATLKNATATKPFSYLSKPFHENDILAALTMVNEQVLKNNSETGLLVKSMHRSLVVPASDITFIKADNVYVEINTSDKVYIERYTIKSLEEKLDSKIFLRVHRSFLINKNFIDSWKTNTVFVNRYEIPISKKYKHHFIQYLTK